MYMYCNQQHHDRQNITNNAACTAVPYITNQVLAHLRKHYHTRVKQAPTWVTHVNRISLNIARLHHSNASRRKTRSSPLRTGKSVGSSRSGDIHVIRFAHPTTVQACITLTLTHRTGGQDRLRFELASPPARRARRHRLRLEARRPAATRDATYSLRIPIFVC